MIKMVTSETIVDQQMIAIGKKVRELRKKKNRNYETWCSLHHINKVTLNRLERGASVKLKLILEIIQKLEQTPEEFFNGIH